MTAEHNHPITPPPELIQQWLGEHFGTTVTGEVSAVEQHIAAQAARWGADQELEACCEWLDEVGPAAIQLWGDDLRQDRRPNPPSPKQQALDVLKNADGADHPIPVLVLPGDEAEIIRRALEALPD